MADDTVSDVQTWLDRRGSGDAAARDLLLLFVRERWQGFARRALHGSHKRLDAFVETEDVLSEVCVRVLKDWERGHAPATAVDFFRQVEQNFRHVLVDLCRKHYGRAGDRPATRPLDAGSDAAPGHDPGTDTLDPAEVAQWAEFHRQVDALPEEVRAVFRLRWYLDLTVAEVAQTLGVSTRTVTERWVEARLRLGAALPSSLRPVGSP